MPSNYNEDYDREPPSYYDVTTTPNYNYSSYNGRPLVGPSDSPHESDDEETTVLKSELRRLRERNLQTASHAHTPGRTFIDVQSHPTSTTVHFSTNGTVYQHPTVTSHTITTTTQSRVGDGRDKEPNICARLCGCFCMILSALVILIIILI